MFENGDTQQIEWIGLPDTAFTGCLVVLEGRTINSNPGAVLSAHEVPAGSSFDAKGFLTVTVPNLIGSPLTLVVMDTFTGGVGTDIDTDNTSTFCTVYDAIGIWFASFFTLYGAALGGTDFSNIPTAGA